MKKTLLSAISLISFGLFAQAQTTITSSDVGSTIGTSKYQAQDTLPASSITVTGPGSGQTWDFTALNIHNVDTLTFLNPSTAPNSASFPNATHCFQTQADGNLTYTYLNTTSTSVRAIGATLQNPFGTNDLVIKINPSQMIAAFPASVGSGTTTSYYRFKIQLSGAEVGQAQLDSVRLILHGKRLITPDADGSLQTIDGTKNVLRIETISLDTNDTEGKIAFLGWTPLQQTFDTSYTYDFWANGEGFPIVSISYDYYNAVVTNVTHTVLNPLGINKTSLNQELVQLFPNPNNGSFRILTKENSLVNVYDVMGREVYAADLEAGLTSVTISENSGVYLVKSTNKNSGEVTTQRLIINK